MSDCTGCGKPEPNEWCWEQADDCPAGKPPRWKATGHLVTDQPARWTPEQLAKWRIRKAPPDAQPPWVRYRFDRRIDGALEVMTFAPRWWVYAPGDVGPSACWGTRDSAMDHVSDVICNNVIEKYRKAYDQ